MVGLAGRKALAVSVAVSTYPTLSVSVGHVYAAGVFIALAHDYKVMQSERGWWCLNEVHIKRNFSVALLEMIK